MPFLSLEDLKPYYDIPQVNFTKSALFWISNFFNAVKTSSFSNSGWHVYDQIAPNLYLGRLPSKEMDMPKNIKLIVSMSTYPELAGKGLVGSEIVKPTEWAAEGIKQLLVYMEDFSAEVSSNDVLRALEEMRACEGGKYVHCKAGRSRSALLVALYLVFYGSGDEQLVPNQPLATVLAYMATRRVQISLGAAKLAKAQEIIDLYNQRRAANTASSSTDVVVPQISTQALEIELNSFAAKKSYAEALKYLASLEAKNFICGLMGFKDLAVYAVEVQSHVKGCKRTDDIKEFFLQILNSTNGIWFDELYKGEGHMQALIHHRKDDVEMRKQLVENFKAELQAHLIFLGYEHEPAVVVQEQPALRKVMN